MKNDITIKSTVSATVVMNVPSLHLNRTWLKKGAIQKIPMEILEQAIYDPGVEYLFKTGILYIDDIETKIALGLEDPDNTEEPSILLIDDATAKKLLQETPLKEFRETLEKLSHDQIVELAKTAVDLKITDYQRDKLLKEKTEIDVFSIVTRVETDEEENN